MYDKESEGTQGLQRLVQKYKEEFKQPENTQYYSEEDYAAAQKRYVSFRLNHG